MEINIILKNRLKQERIMLNLSQHDIAVKVGTSNKNISKYEQGLANPSLETLTKLADIFDCTVDYLLGRTDDRDNKVFVGVVDGKKHTLEIDKSESDMPNTEQKFNRLVKKLRAIGFDIDKLMEEQANIDLDND